MNLRRLPVIILGPALLVTSAAGAAPPTSAPAPHPTSAPASGSAFFSEADRASLTRSMRSLLVQTLPDPLYSDSANWGGTKAVVSGVKWKGQGFKVHPELVKTQKYDGVWSRVTLTAPQLADSLALDLRNFQTHPGAGTTFDAFLSFDARAEGERQKWKSGVRIYGGSARVRCRVNLALKCELTTHLEKHPSALPDLVFRVRVVHADLSYDHLVCEHLVGLEGDPARLIGEAVRSGLHRFRPSLERDLIARAEAAIVKAGDTKDVHIGVGRIMGH